MNDNKTAKKPRYQPNLSDPRIRKRFKEALGWAYLTLGQGPKMLSEKKTITKNLGQYQEPMGRYLRGTLLNIADGYYRPGQACKTYCLNKAGFTKLLALLEQPYERSRKTYQESMTPEDLAIAWVESRFGTEMSTKDFQYESKVSARLWHPLQNLQKTVVNLVWTHYGLPNDYDVKACAPTLLKEHAVECGMSAQTPSLDTFLEHARDFREHVAASVGITYEQAKTVINALFCGASLEANPAKAIFRMLDLDKAKSKRLRELYVVQQLVNDIKLVWTYIKPLGATSKQKWHVYFQLERKVLDAVRAYLDTQAVKHFCIHDGFRTDMVVDVMALSAFVLSSTGYLVTFTSSTVSSGLLQESSVMVPSQPFIRNSSGILPRGPSSYDSRPLSSPRVWEVSNGESHEDSDELACFDLDEEFLKES
jgi:hypothetical protein